MLSTSMMAGSGKFSCMSGWMDGDFGMAGGTTERHGRTLLASSKDAILEKDIMCVTQGKKKRTRCS